MKLIDILVEELPKRDGWPEKASHAVYAKRFSRVCFTVGGAPAITGDDVSIFEDDGAGHGVFWLPGALLDCEEPIDYATAIITREQYEAALAASKHCDHKWIPSEGRTQSGYLCSKCGNYDGPGYDWIDWPGGECPVPRGTLVDVKYLCGDVNRHIKAGEPDSSGSIDTAFAVRWSKLGAEYDIIAYRLHQPQEVAQDEADDENDLNECIGHGVAPVWNGEGLPPVGCECECQFRGGWQKCTILFSGKQIVVAMVDDDEYPFESKGSLFRPIRSEAERKRDAIISIIDKAYKECPHREAVPHAIYEAIAEHIR